MVANISCSWPTRKRKGEGGRGKVNNEGGGVGCMI
jgi:hypothetical protein